MDNFFSLLKQEMYHRETLCSFEELKSKIERHIDKL
ncbi:IS3 family transposase [Oceanobacillus salinisoli]